MLVMRRRTGDVVRIGSTTEIRILECSRTRVKIGITAPRELVVTWQNELVAQENRSASRSIPPEELTLTLEELASKLPACDAAGRPSADKEP